ncbi:MAG: hypothetical protein KF795_33320 [Labilithrix sp.]|nr:hypothetical protein [Labilithrix sp.]
MKRAAPATFAVLGLLSLLALRAPDARAAESANDCVHLREGQSGDGLSLAIDNNCDRGLSCSLSWIVQCESATGKVTRRSKDGARLVVEASGSRTATASAKSCGDNWRIEDVSWDCAPLK